MGRQGGDYDQHAGQRGDRRVAALAVEPSPHQDAGEEREAHAERRRPFPVFGKADIQRAAGQLRHHHPQRSDEDQGDQHPRRHPAKQHGVGHVDHNLGQKRPARRVETVAPRRIPTRPRKQHEGQKRGLQQGPQPPGIPRLSVHVETQRHRHRQPCRIEGIEPDHADLEEVRHEPALRQPGVIGVGDDKAAQEKEKVDRKIAFREAQGAEIGADVPRDDQKRRDAAQAVKGREHAGAR